MWRYLIIIMMMSVACRSSNSFSEATLEQAAVTLRENVRLKISGLDNSPPEKFRRELWEDGFQNYIRRDFGTEDIYFKAAAVALDRWARCNLVKDPAAIGESGWLAEINFSRSRIVVDNRRDLSPMNPEWGSSSMGMTASRHEYLANRSRSWVAEVDAELVLQRSGMELLREEQTFRVYLYSRMNGDPPLKAYLLAVDKVARWITYRIIETSGGPK